MPTEESSPQCQLVLDGILDAAVRAFVFFFIYLPPRITPVNAASDEAKSFSHLLFVDLTSLAGQRLLREAARHLVSVRSGPVI